MFLFICLFFDETYILFWDFDEKHIFLNPLKKFAYWWSFHKNHVFSDLLSKIPFFHNLPHFLFFPRFFAKIHVFAAIICSYSPNFLTITFMIFWQNLHVFFVIFLPKFAYFCNLLPKFECFLRFCTKIWMFLLESFAVIWMFFRILS